ncbi:class I SAM-dependent methyltransferase [Patescibacteria group bacterium]|nr:class I SAM-dependent methyltransferase [Patescibacteria group bacterium]
MVLSKQQKAQEDQYFFPYHYSDLASEYEKLFFSAEYFSRIALVKKEIEPFNNQSVLDAGCGDGRLCYELKKENVDISGIDYSERAIAFAKAFNPELDFYIGKMESISLDKKFDVIILMEVLEHFKEENIDGILANLSNLLKEDGKLIITVPSINSPIHKKHYQHFTEESLRKTIGSYFKINKILGYAKKTHRLKIFILLLQLNYLLYPFRNSFKFVKRILKYPKKYYEKHIEKGEPENCDGLIAVCSKCDDLEG